MINQQLLTYIKKQQEAGTDNATIKDNLQSAGWREEDIEEGFQTVENNSGGGNSTATHQKIRAEAAQRRDGQPANTTDDNDEVDLQTTTESDTEEMDINNSTTDDAYREPVTESDQADSGGTDGETNLSPIDERSGTRTNQSSPANASPEAPDSTGSQPATKDQSSEQAEQAIDSTVNTEKSLESLDTQKQDESDNSFGPFPVRTYHSDSERAGGPARKSPKMNRPTTSSPAKESRGKPRAVDSSPGSSQEEGEYKVSADSQSDNQKKAKRQQQKRRRAAAEVREKKAEQEEEVISKQSSRKSAGSSMMSVEGTDREAGDGRRRFSTGGDAAKAMQKAAARRQSRNSSGSNMTAMLMFVLALVLVGGGAVYAYLAYFQTNVPETTASEVMESLAAAETFNFRTTIQSAGGAASGGNSLIIEGAVDLNTDTPTKSYYTITSGDQSQPPVTSVMAEVENINAVPDAQRETVRDVVLSPEFFSIGEFQTEEKLADFTTNRYSVSADSRQLVSDYATLHQALFNSPLSEEVLSQLQTTAGQFSPTQGQAWINPETGVPYQITFLGTGGEGQEMQINFQFKNHGSQLETTPAYEPRSFERSLNEYFAASSASTPDDDNQADDDEQATTSDDSQATSTEPDDGQSAEEVAAEEADQKRREDQLRINDIQQIAVALRMHANETGSFPDSLAQLRDSEITVMTEIPRDPVSDISYSYSVSDAGDLYHLGATLSALERSEAPNDTNFNSRGQGFTNGFNGATSSCGQTSETASTSICYDITGGVE